MKRLGVVVFVLGCCIATGYALYDNHRLRQQLAGDSKPVCEPSAKGDADSNTDEVAPEKRRRPGLLQRLGQRTDDRPRPKLGETPKETRAERRQRRSRELRDLLGRLPGETADEYRDRVRPLVVAGLAEPRTRLADARAQAEQAAKLSDDQRAAVDAVLADTYDEAINLANDAIASGDLSPYRRNWAGALGVAGGFGAVLSSAEQRIGDVLSPEQRDIIYERGFEWGEYIGAQAPWETLNPPPEPSTE